MRSALFTKILFLTSSLLLMGMRPVSQDYTEPAQIKEEFDNIMENAQDQQFIVATSTPVLGDMKEGQFFIVFSTINMNAIIHLKVGETRFIFRSEKFN